MAPFHFFPNAFEKRKNLVFRKKISQLTDLELLEKYKQDGRTQWVGELYTRYHHLVFGVCLKYLKNADGAKDAVLAIFEKLLTDLQKRDVATFQHWLYAVSKNYCLEQIRKSSREEKRKVVFHQDNFNHAMDELEVLSLTEMREAGLRSLEEAIGLLNNDQQQCVELFYLQEKSYKQITETTGYTLNEVKSHIQNGRRNLRLLLEKKG